jgi:two-component system OmpR family response regulator
MLGPMRCLLIEDERPLALATAEALRDAGWVVELAHDGRTGLEMALTATFDVVVVDIMLPSLNGYDVLKGIRTQGAHPPVLMLTAKDGEYDETDAFDLGADDYVTKPFHASVLAARLQALTRRGRPEPVAEVVVGDLRLHPLSQRVHRGETEIRLTSREFALLHHFMQHPDAVLSKAQLLEEVWDSDYPGADNVVEVYVGYLRKKIDHAFQVNTLETVRGRGYRLTGGR